ncbi:MAG: DUF1697 domain-containing protein [Longimicrobiales bacterium]
MHSYVALLRGINVGGHRVKMDALREHFTDMGLEDIWTFIASGNVGFSPERDNPMALADDIEQHLEQALGFGVPTFLRTADELDSVITFDPPVPSGWDRLAASHCVIFLHEPAPESVTAALRDLESDHDRFVVHGREIHWLTRGKLSESPLFGAGIEHAMREVPTTTRNTTSLRRLVAKATANAVSRSA